MWMSRALTARTSSDTLWPRACRAIKLLASRKTSEAASMLEPGAVWTAWTLRAVTQGITHLPTGWAITSRLPRTATARARSGSARLTAYRG